jgi:hypothetical protein
MGGDTGLGPVGIDIDVVTPLDQAGDLIEERSLPEHRKFPGQKGNAHSATSGSAV